MPRRAVALLFLAACTPTPTSLPSVESPAPKAKAALMVAAPPAAPAAERVAACPEAPPDPDGWFPLGDPALPDGSRAVDAANFTLGFDEANKPFAVVGADGTLVLAAPGGDKVRTEPIGQLRPYYLAAGAGAKGLVVAAVLDTQKTVVFSREEGQWRRREVGLFCMGAHWSGEFGSMGSWPSMIVDGAGSVWQACVERTYAPARMMPSSGKLLSARIRLGRLVGARWVESFVPLPLRGDSTGEIALSTGANGEPVARLSSGDSTSYREIIVPVRVTGGVPQYATPKVSAGARPGSPPDGFGVGALRVASGCTGEGPCSFEGEGGVRLDLPVAPNAIARRGDAWFAAVAAPLRIAVFESARWKMVMGDAPPGVSATPTASTGPLIALDRCGRSAITWREAGSKIAGRAWDGRSFRPLPSIDDTGPHGLVLRENGDILVGSWTGGEKASLRVRRIAARDTVESLPPLMLSTDEWRVIDAGRTRLTDDGVLHAAFPQRENVFAMPARTGYALRDGQWQREEVPASLLEAQAMPWGADARAAERSALAIDESGRRVIVWADGLDLRVSEWAGGGWRPLPVIAAGRVLGVPAIAARAGRLCVAWSGPSGLSSEIFVRCHRWKT